VAGEHQWGHGVASDKVAEGGAHPRGGSIAREGWRRRLDDVPRQRRSLVAEEGGDEVLQLEEETEEVRDHPAEEKGKRGSSSPWRGEMTAVAA
jgi:hypothetical protein